MQLPPINKALIFCAYFAPGQTRQVYALQGPLQAASILNRSGIDTRVIHAQTSYPGIDYKALWERVEKANPDILFFSHISTYGINTMLILAAQARERGIPTVIAGPGARLLFEGEKGVTHPLRFLGWSSVFNYALQGPAEQVLPLLDFIGGKISHDPRSFSGLSCLGSGNEIISTPPQKWNPEHLSSPDWTKADFILPTMNTMNTFPRITNCSAPHFSSPH